MQESSITQNEGNVKIKNVQLADHADASRISQAYAKKRRNTNHVLPHSANSARNIRQSTRGLERKLPREIDMTYAMISGILEHYKKDRKRGQMSKNQLDKAIRLMKDDSAESNFRAYAMIAKSLVKMRAERKKRGIKTESGIERAIRIFLKDS